MDNNKMIEDLVREVLKSMQGTSSQDGHKSVERVTKSSIDGSEYPLGDNIPDKIFSHTGVKLTDITLDKVINGEISSDDFKISSETLEMQSKVAESVNRDSFSGNLKRAAELIAIPDERILEIYDAMRPYRSTKKELIAIADELENKYGCKINSKFIREAADVYEERGRLNKAT
jgi:propanediol dehydratase small subunit